MVKEVGLLKEGQKQLLVGVTKLSFSDSRTQAQLLYLMYLTPSKRRNVIGGLTEELFMKNRIDICLLLKLFEIVFHLHFLKKIHCKIKSWTNEWSVCFPLNLLKQDYIGFGETINTKVFMLPKGVVSYTFLEVIPLTSLAAYMFNIKGIWGQCLQHDVLICVC